MEEQNKVSDGEKALEEVREKEKALRALIAIGKELDNESGALAIVDSIASGKKLPLTQQAFIAAQEKTKGLSIEEMARYFKGMEQKSAKCLKIICLRTEILDEDEIQGPAVDLAENVSLLKVTKAFRKGAASTQAIESLISKRNPLAKLKKSDGLRVPVEKVRTKLKELKKEEFSLRKEATGKASNIQDDLKKIMNDPNVSDKVREAAKEMSEQVAIVEQQLKEKKSSDIEPIRVEEITLSGDTIEEEIATPEVEEIHEVEEIVAPPPPPEEEPEEEKTEEKAAEPPKPEPKPEPAKTQTPPKPSQPEFTYQVAPEPKGFIRRILDWLLEDIFKK
ncbi:MAG: hypothetical protein D6B28_08880 [Gammaproteobacteria bacterium]|nr:MAG: hypothetical protein D6B28_08880 [Gammaproteobacteria bacterium]